MDGIEKITARIQADAVEEIARLKAETDVQIRDIQDRAQEKAEQERADILNRSRRAADERLERLKSAAQMEARKLALIAKQEVLDEAFQQTLDRLCDLPEEEYVQLLTGLALKAVVTGKEQMVFSQQDRTRIGKQVVVAVNEALVKQVAPELPGTLGDSKVGAFLGKMVNSATAQITGTGLLTLAEETRPIRGGFILVNGPVETNCSFETLVRLQREKLEKDVANILFQE